MLTEAVMFGLRTLFDPQLVRLTAIVCAEGLPLRLMLLVRVTGGDFNLPVNVYGNSQQISDDVGTVFENILLCSSFLFFTKQNMLFSIITSERTNVTFLQLSLRFFIFLTS